MNTALGRPTETVIVAHSHARSRGNCQHHGCVIDRGDPIIKVDVGRRGPQTSEKNGQGEWWCLDCALAFATE